MVSTAAAPMNYNAHFQIHLEKLRPPHISSVSALHTRASEAGWCDRMLYYRLQRYLATGVNDEVNEYTTSIAFHIGNNLHDEYQAMMSILHPTFSGEVNWIHGDPPIVTGRCDGTYTDARGKRIALEIKTCSKFSFTRAIRSGNPDPKHALQAALSALVLHCDALQIVYICKEYVADIDGERADPIRIWTYPTPIALAEEEIQRHASLTLAARSGAPVPPRMARGEPILDPERDDECRFCPFKDDCIIDGPPIPLTVRRNRKK